MTEMECEGQLAEGCSQKELRSGEAHTLLARSDDADFLPFRSAGAMVPMGLAVKKPVCGLKGCERSCHERPAHEGGYFQYCGRTHGREAVMRELELQKEATPEQAGGNGRRVCALEGCQSFCHARPAKEGGGEYLYCRQIRMDGWRRSRGKATGQRGERRSGRRGGVRRPNATGQRVERRGDRSDGAPQQAGVRPKGRLRRRRSRLRGRGRLVGSRRAGRSRGGTSCWFLTRSLICRMKGTGERKC